MENSIVGYVFFERGRLVRAGKPWPRAGSDYDIVHTDSDALDHLREEGFSTCSVYTRKVNEPRMDHAILSIGCGQKSVTLDASGEPVTGVDVYEEIVNLSPGTR